MDSSNLIIRTVGQGWFYQFVWPNDGQGHSPIFEYGLLLGALVNGTPRASDGEYRPDFYPGIIQNTSIADSGRNPKYRVYKVQKNWESLAESDVKNAFEKDYEEWPVDLGAPVDSAGKPLIYGDQMLWMVYRDNEPSWRSLSHGLPLGAEIRTAVWAYKNDPILKNVVFVKHTVTNKSDAPWVNAYVGNLTDGGYSVGNSSAMYTGTDSIIGAAYVYSPYTGSSSFYGTDIPALGYVHLQGPLVASPGSVGFQTGKTLPGKRNLPMTSAVKDPFSGSHLPSSTPVGWYNGLQGLWSDSAAIVDPVSGRVVRFSQPGDPVTGTGWTAYTQKSNTGYLYTSTGPFDLQPGESQDVVGAYIAGPGRDHLLSVNVFKYFVRYVKSAYPFMFGASLPKPSFNVSIISRKVIITWDNTIENQTVPLSTYKFQGYHVYQGESASGPWHRVATFDKKDNIPYLSEETYSTTLRALNSQIIEDLPNKGLQYYYTAERDTLTGTPLILGHQYYFALTAFWHDDNSRPMNRESDIVPIVATVQSPVAGSSFMEPKAVIPHDRPHDDAVQVIDVDPSRLVGKQYHVTISFTPVDSSIRWTLTENPNIPRLVDYTDTTGSTSNPIVDGFTVAVKKPLVGVRRDNQDPQGWEYFPKENRWMTGAGSTFIMDGFFTGVVYPRRVNFEGRGSLVHPDSLKRVEIRFGETQKAYRYVSFVRVFPPDPPRDQAYIPFIKAHGPGLVYQDFVDVPFTVWEIDSLDGDGTPKQLNVAFTENNDSLTSASGKYLGRGNVDGKWAPTTSATGGDEKLYIFASPYSSSPLPLYTTAEPKFKQDSLDIMYMLYPKADATLRKDKQTTWTAGDRFIISPNYNLVNGRTFTFSPMAPVLGSAALAKQTNSLERITVFPNPYLGGHSLETSATDRFVTFTNLPSQCVIRVFNLAGRLVRTLSHNSTSSSLERWNLRNDEGIAVASGLYVAHIEAKDIGSKVLKLMVLFPDERIRTF